MLLMIKAWGSDTWYDKVMPLLAAAGFEERVDLHVSDPESDGELMYNFFELTSDELSYGELKKLVEQAQSLIEKGGGPPLELSLVHRK